MSYHIGYREHIGHPENIYTWTRKIASGGYIYVSVHTHVCVCACVPVCGCGCVCNHNKGKELLIREGN